MQHPTHVVIIMSRTLSPHPIGSTVAYSKEEAKKIGNNFDNQDEFPVIMEIDYSMRDE